LSSDKYLIRWPYIFVPSSVNVVNHVDFWMPNHCVIEKISFASGLLQLQVTFFLRIFACKSMWGIALYCLSVSAEFCYHRNQGSETLLYSMTSSMRLELFLNDWWAAPKKLPGLEAFFYETVLNYERNCFNTDLFNFLFLLVWVLIIQVHEIIFIRFLNYC
jgi:hypothetical protein